MALARAANSCCEYTRSTTSCMARKSNCSAAPPGWILFGPRIAWVSSPCTRCPSSEGPGRRRSPHCGHPAACRVGVAASGHGPATGHSFLAGRGVQRPADFSLAECLVHSPLATDLGPASAVESDDPGRRAIRRRSALRPVVSPRLAGGAIPEWVCLQPVAVAPSGLGGDRGGADAAAPAIGAAGGTGGQPGFLGHAQVGWAYRPRARRLGLRG